MNSFLVLLWFVQYKLWIQYIWIYTSSTCIKVVCRMNAYSLGRCTQFNQFLGYYDCLMPIIVINYRLRTSMFSWWIHSSSSSSLIDWFDWKKVFSFFLVFFLFVCCVYVSLTYLWHVSNQEHQNGKSSLHSWILHLS